MFGAYAAVCVVATCRLVWRGGTTWNDHAVAAVVTGCIGIYPLLLALADHRGAVLAAALAPGPFAIYGLFHAMDTRRDPGLFWTIAARIAQPAMAFSLWTGLVLLLRTPVAVLAGASVWPGGWLLLPVVLTAWGTAWTYARHFSVRRNRVAVGVGDPVRIVHLSDIHASPAMVRRDIRAVVERAAALSPDLVLVTGDHLMPFSEEEHGYLVEELAKLPVPVVACLGNHDLPVAERLAAEFREAGMHLLVDQSMTCTVRGRVLELAGVKFHWKGARLHLEAALATLQPSPAEIRVLLAHDPRLYAWLPEGRFDLVLSGHTHGGQVGTDMFGVPWSVLRPLGVYDQGRFDSARGSLWVHRGNWHTGLPPRMGIAGEIVVHEVG